MNEYRGQTFTRISKAAAKKLYERGEEIYMLPCKLNPEGMYFQPMGLQIDEENGSAFDSAVNAAEYYNCNYECGYYMAFYREV